MKYSREEAIKKVRHYLAANTRPDENTCQAAARLGIFCHGYDQWNIEQLRDLYPWLSKRMPAETAREDFLKLVVAWDGARQLVQKAPTICDAHQVDHDACLGFDRFSNAQLKRLFPQLFGADDEIAPW